MGTSSRGRRNVSQRLAALLTRKRLLAALLLLGAGAVASAQNVVTPLPAAPTGPGKHKPKAPTPSRAAKAAKKKESVHKIRKDTLLYGINSQVISLLGTLEREKDTSLDSEVVTVLKQSADTKVQRAALHFLDTVKDWNATATARKIISDRIQTGATGNGKLVTTAIQYLSDAKDSSALPTIEKLAKDQNATVAFEALSAIGKMGTSKQAAKLLKDLKDPNYPQKLKPQVILALGKLKYTAAVPELTKILKNHDQQLVMREYSCAALGEIGDPKSISAVKAAYSSTNDYLRAYAVSSIGYFKGKEVNALLIQALKDSFWRVRVNAAKSLGKKQAAEALPILEYKARYDPQIVVRRAAINAIGQVDDPKGFSFLRSVFSNSLVDASLREVAVTQLVKKDLKGSLKTIETFIRKGWSKPHAPVFDYVCKQLSQAKDPQLESLFQRFLGSPSLNIQIYGLRGIRLNDFKGLLKKVKPFDGPKENLSVRAAAEAAIRKLK